MTSQQLVLLLTQLSTGETPFFEDLAIQLAKIRSLSNQLLAGSQGISTAVSPVFSYTPGPISISNEICDFTIQNVPDSSLADEGNLLYTRRYGGVAIVAGKDEKYLGKLSDTDIPIFDRYIHNRIKDYKMHVTQKTENSVSLQLVPTEFH